MSSETQTSSGPTKARIGTLVTLCVIAGILWAANWFLLSKFITDQAARGQFGDMFGAVNALFTALAFAGLIYTVLLQRDQLALQQREINESGEIQRKLVQDQIEAQRQLFEQRKVHDLKMEDLRERFYELTEKLRREREVAEENEFKANVLRAIRCELDVLGTIYNQGIGAQFAEVKENQPFLLRLGLTEDWFTVFTANGRPD